VIRARHRFDVRGGRSLARPTGEIVGIDVVVLVAGDQVTRWRGGRCREVHHRDGRRDEQRAGEFPARSMERHTMFEPNE
jgi:hypothetical protein